MVGGLKGGKGLARWKEIRRAVALQLGDLEPSVQQAALRCLKVNPHKCLVIRLQMSLADL